MEALLADSQLGVLSFLSARDVGRCACASSQLAAACAAPEVWRVLLSRDFDPGAEEHAAVCSAAAYRARASRFRAQLASHSQVRKRHLALQRAAKAQATLGLSLTAVGIFSAVLSPYVLLLALLVSVAVAADASALPEGRWALTLVPAWLLAVTSCSWVVLIGYLAKTNATLAETSPWFGQLGRLSWLPCHGAISAVARGRPITAAAVCSLATLVIFQIALICARISVVDPGAFTWAWTASPLWLAISGLAIGSAVISRSLSRKGVGILAAAWCAIGCPLIATAALLVAALDTSSGGELGIPLRLVLVPLWIVAGYERGWFETESG